MRPPALEKAGFFPTSTHVAELLKTYFQPAESGRLLDPCAGEGTAASILAKALHCQSWGAELSPARAALAAEKMERLLNAPWSSCHLTSESITLLFLNPPYSHDRFGDQKRLELEFLKSSTPKLMRGGALIYIVPHRLLHDLDVAAHLAGYYEHLTVHRYPETEFKQVIVLGTKRLKFKAPSHEEIQRVQAWAEIEPPALVDKEQPLYGLLPAPDKGAGGQPIRFTRLDWQPEEVVDATQKHGVLASKEWLDLLNPARALGEFKQPVMPLKKGHIAMLMASGMMGTLRLKDEDGRPLLVKGRVVKVTEKVEEKAGKATTEIFRDRFVSTIAILRQDGIEIIDQVEPLSKFMHKYGDQIGAHILSTYRPLYNFDPTAQETAILDTLGTSRKPLPGQEKAGLLPAQRHVAAGIARAIQKHGVGNVQGEMGAGKAQPLSAKIYTPTGYKLMGEVIVGDQVINPDGGYANVIGVFPQGIMDIYRVTFSDGSFTDCTEDHLWKVRSPLRKWKGRPAYIKPLSQIMSEPLTHPTTGNYQVFIPMTQPVEFKKQSLPLDPYLLGALLGDGHLSRADITSADPEVLSEVTRLMPDGVKLKHCNRYTWRLSKTCAGKTNPVRDILRYLNLYDKVSHTKFVPESFKYSSVEDRLDLLQGLFDTDGNAARSFAVEYLTISPQLALDVKEIVQSLGGTVTLKTKIPTYTYKGEKRNGKLAYRLYVRLPSHIMPFRLSRKANAYRPAGKYEPHRSIVKIEYIGQDYAQCIMLDSENQLYVTDEYIVTHNTTIGAATVELLDAYPAIVLCPPHLVPKWIREIEETIPGAKAMELSRIGRNADDPGDVNDVRQFLDLHAQGKLGSKPVAVMAHTSAKYGAGWEHAAVKKWFVDEDDGRPFQALVCAECGAPIQINLPGGLTVLATSTGDLGEQRRFCQAERTGYELDEHGRVQRDQDGKPVWGKRICGAPLFQFTGRRWAPADYIAKHAKKKFKMLVADECLVKDTQIQTSEGPKAIQDIRVGDLVLSFNHASGQLEYRQVLHTMKNPAPDRLIRAAGIVCTPNHPIFIDEDNYVEAQKILGKKAGILPGEVEISGQPQNGGLEFSRVDRVEILERRSGSGFEQVCPDDMVYNFEVEGHNNYFANGVLVHNCHQFKSKSSDRGVAFHQLVGAARCTLTLTGTFFGGKSTSIFWLLHRLNAGVRRDFAFNDEKRWARLYGVLEVTRKSKRSHDEDEEDGFTGNRRYQNLAKEQPGISPAIVNRLLDTTVFLSLKDLGLSLPHYAEEVVTLTMTHDLAGQYRAMEKKLRDLALNNRRYLSTWLQWTLARPNSAFRDEVVEVDELDPQGEFLRRQRLMDLPAVVTDETLPKESWLVDFCRSERQQGRKVLIYLRQTGTRDIQDRILHILRDGGVRAEVLTSGVNPRKREEWIARRVLGLDALVVNPKLVETGLDLVAFSSVVFAEIEYSLYTLWQAVRRVWRLGQTKPVKAIFSVYSDAMEARALALMGQKMKAAQLLYGDEVGGAIVPEGDDDILMKLAREALESADLPDLQSLFADEVMVSNSPLGCPTAPSALLPVPETPRTISWADWMKQKDLAAGRAASRPRSKPGAQNQISLF